MSSPGSSPSVVPCRGDRIYRKRADPMCANHDVPGGSSSSRRGFLFKLGLALNVIGAALVGIPVIGYILAPARRLGGQAWIKLGAAAKFPEGETRLGTYENPFRVEWDGASAKVACW